MIEQNIEDEAERYRLASENLLRWYDNYGRTLPWRSAEPDPYAVWLSEIMLQQTTVTAVQPYYARFLERWQTVEELAQASEEEVMQEWAGLGYYSRARNLHKCAKEIVKIGVFPSDYQSLKALPGIGDYTAAAIASIVYGEPVLALDGNVKRVLSRLNRIDEPIEKIGMPMKSAQHGFQNTKRTGDIAQAFMDLASRHCKAKKPLCADCPLQNQCRAYKEQAVDEYPKRRAKAPKKRWVGRAYIYQNRDQQIWLIKRPNSGVLAGMWALPSSKWAEVQSDALPDAKIWTHLGTVTHIFTHIHLELDVWHSLIAPTPDEGEWFDIGPEHSKNLPKLWQKALELLAALEDN